jgi:hypothetical protein
MEQRTAIAAAAGLLLGIAAMADDYVDLVFAAACLVALGIQLDAARRVYRGTAGVLAFGGAYVAVFVPLTVAHILAVVAHDGSLFLGPAIADVLGYSVIGLFIALLVWFTFACVLAARKIQGSPE